MSDSNKSKIRHAVLQDIIMGEYQPGDVLSERKLMEKYNVSKSPVREALVELCSENVLRSIPRYGYELIALTEADIRNVLQFRVMVETQCLALVSQHTSREDLLALRRFALEDGVTNNDMEVWQAWENNSRFHLRMLSYCANRYCYEQVERSLGFLTRAYAQFYWDHWKRITFSFDTDDHISIVDALLSDNLAEAQRILTKDIDSFGVCMERNSVKL